MHKTGATGVRVCCLLCKKELSICGLAGHIWRAHGKGSTFKPSLGKQAWNKGKDITNPIVAAIAQKVSAALTGRRKVVSTEKLRYCYDCDFNFNLSSYSEEFNFALVKQYGWYKAKNKGNNLDGISRDHMLSIAYGWKYQIPAIIIAHPANCRLVQHRENQRKRHNSCISYEELIERINIWQQKYPRLVGNSIG